ncbi:hypothetical protein Pelsub_P1819 [Pelolinea submarina]|nr:hypothetical protein Pelsub_P1819 [Pelolinea submarina]
MTKPRPAEKFLAALTYAAESLKAHGPQCMALISKKPPAAAIKSAEMKNIFREENSELFT